MVNQDFERLDGNQQLLNLTANLIAEPLSSQKRQPGSEGLHRNIQQLITAIQRLSYNEFRQFIGVINQVRNGALRLGDGFIQLEKQATTGENLSSAVTASKQLHAFLATSEQAFLNDAAIDKNFSTDIILTARRCFQRPGINVINAEIERESISAKSEITISLLSQNNMSTGTSVVIKPSEFPNTSEINFSGYAGTEKILLSSDSAVVVGRRFEATDAFGLSEIIPQIDVGATISDPHWSRGAVLIARHGDEILIFDRGSRRGVNVDILNESGRMSVVYSPKSVVRGNETLFGTSILISKD